jgi:hypothetical protein
MAVPGNGLRRSRRIKVLLEFDGYPTNEELYRSIRVTGQVVPSAQTGPSVD